MQTVIFAAGEGKRLRPLTENKPKPLVEVGGKPILERTLSSLPDEVDEAVLVIGYKGEMIRKYFGDNFNGLKITYVHQEKPLGTFNALKTTEPFLEVDRFLCLVGDDIYRKDDLVELIKYEMAILVAEREDVSRFGLCVPDERGDLKEIIEKPADREGGGLVFTGATVLTHDIFKEEVVYGESGEEILPPMIASMGKKFPVKMVEASAWHPIAYPEDIKKAETLVG